MPVHPQFSSAIEPSAQAKLQSFLDGFYEASDTKPGDDDPYLGFLTADADIKMGLNSIKGHDGIKEMRKGMWKFVTKRHHDVLLVAPIGETEFLLKGFVTYTLVNGKELTTEWAGHAVFADAKFEKLKFYQVYLDSSQMKDALQN